MKPRKILLLTGLLAGLLLFVGCYKAPEQEEAPAPKPSTAEPFVLKDDDLIYSDIVQYDGKIVSVNKEHNLIALETSYFLSTNEESKEIIIYDMNTKKELYSESITTPYNSDRTINTLSVSLDNYPIIQIATKYQTLDYDDEGQPAGYIGDATYKYFLAGNYDAPIESGITDDRFNVTTVQNMYLCQIADNIYWISKDCRILHTEKSIISDSYINVSMAESFFDFDAEYNGYLYAWEYTELSRKVMVFNREGDCVVQYSHDPKTIATTVENAPINPFIAVLDDGNIFVQECLEVDKNSSKYDFINFGKKLKVSSKIINYKTGEVEELDLDYLVISLESAYSRIESDEQTFPLELKRGYENQAYIAKFGDKKIEDSLQYVVLDNKMAVKFTLKNEYLAESGDYASIHDATETYYYAHVKKGQMSEKYMFDYDGNVVCVVPYSVKEIWKDHFVTDFGIYKTNKKLVFSFENTIFASPNTDKGNLFEYWNGELYIQRYNYMTGATEVYKMTEEKYETVMVYDGIDTELNLFDDYGILHNTDTDTYTIINSRLEPVLKLQGAQTDNGELSVEECDGTLYVSAYVNEKPVLYVINLAEPKAPAKDK